MGTVKKLGIAAIIGAMMALMFAVGLMPSPGALGVFAASGDGPKDVRDIMDLILGNGGDGSKGGGTATGITIGVPGDGSTVFVRQDSPTAVLPVHATLDPMGTEGTVRVGINGTVQPGSMSWNGDIASPDDPIQAGDGITVTSIDVAPLGTAALTTTTVRMYGLGMETAKQFGAITINYTVLDQIDFDVEIVDGLMNPFTDLGDGEIYVADEADLADAGRLFTVFADLDVTGGLLPSAAKGGLDGRTDLNGVVTVPVELGGGPTGPRVIVQAVSLADLQAAFPTFIGAMEQAVLVVRVASTSDGLVGAAQAADLDDVPSAMTAGAQLVQIAIIYTTDNGVGNAFAEVEELEGLDIPVVLTFENLPAAKQLSLTRGVAFFGHDTFIDFMPDPDEFIQVPSDSSVTWVKRFGSVLDPFNQVLTIDLEYLSVFSAFESILEIASIYPSIGGFPGGDSVAISGAFQTQPGVVDEDAYIVFFGDPADPTRMATVTGTTTDNGTITELIVDTPALAASDDDVQVDVTVQDASTPSDFVTALQAFTYSAAPILNAIMPNMGPLNPTTAVTLTGMHLAGLDAATKVYFGMYTVQSSAFTAADPAGMSIDVIPPAVTNPGTVDVSIMTALGMYTIMDGFEYFGPATIDSFDPMTGLDDGGQTVVIMGTNFFGTPIVELAGVAATVDAVNVAGTQLTVTSGAVTVDPGMLPPEGPVTVDNGSGETMSAENFRYLSDPIITTFDPMVGPSSGGQTVTITGEHLRDITSITIAGIPVVALPVETAPYTSIEIVTPPADPGDEGPIVISSAGGVAVSADDYRYEFDAPVIDSFTPAFGSTAGGTVLTILGGGFGGVDAVTIAGVDAASFTIVSDTQIEATTAAVTVAAGAQAPQGFVVVSNPDASGTSLGAFRYVAPPTIDDFSPMSGDAGGGDLITVTGEHLNPLDITNVTIAGFTVNLGTLGDVSPVSAPFTVLEFTTPAGAVGAEGPIVITNVVNDIATSADDFLYELRRPIIDAFAPLTGPIAGGTQVTITGAGFTGSTEVILAGVTAASFTVNSDTQITATTAAVAVGPGEQPPAGPVTVENPEGVSNDSAENFRYVAPPVIDSFTPMTGPGDGGTMVTITGEHLRDIQTVTVAGVTVTAPIIGEADPFTSITIETPAAPFGTPPGPIVVTTLGGAGASAENFTYEFDIEELTVDTVTPNDAWIFGGVITEISGTGFIDDPAFVYNVMFGTETATVVGVSDDGGLLVQVPPSADVDDTTVLTDTVDVSVARVINGNMNPADPVVALEPFNYTRFDTDGGVFTTAAMLSGGVGTIEILLDKAVATLDVPVNTGSAAGNTTDVYVLARASTMLNSFGTTPDVAANGVNLADSYTYFDVHFYRQGAAPADPMAGDFGLMEVTGGFEFGEGDEAAMLSTVIGSENLAAESVLTGQVALFQDATSALGAPRALSFPNPAAVPVLAGGTVERYQSMLLDGEYTLDATDTFVEELVDVRISNLGVIVVRDDVVLDFDALGIMPFLSSEDMSGLDDQLPVTIESNRGGLGYIDRIEIIERETGETKIIPRTALPNLANSMGENEFVVTAMMPTVDEPGTVDIEVFLPSGASFTLEDAFQFTGDQPVFPLTLILLALAALIGLAAAGDGGGGGGPCFIATAAYGTPIAAEIEVLRDVRDGYLLDNAVGAAFVDVYYTVSPAIADVVAQSPVLAALVRIALMPVIFFGKIVLTAPLAGVTIALMAMALALAHRARKRARSLRAES